ncbi:right-handed parallel beta-helix repeat-containing protein [Lignipirellula cremea]|uniref:Pectate lyase superfamily protein n=1 Tax=Lignipirellula cremea TaxID=2528010 RepID=A0A518DYW9_9BACT|nr:right-handed parallel beta-helix repeat-containing protein [Lignipirellula cremea]QDU96991.1 Pectate lyase superfamily protein [Lignipirellula cremea]
MTTWNHPPQPQQAGALVRFVCLATFAALGVAPVDHLAAADSFDWIPSEALADGSRTADTGEQILPTLTETATPKATADLAKFTREYTLELGKFGISNQGRNPVETSKGINAALQHAKTLKANRILFPPGEYLLSAADPIVIDHQDTVINLNGAVLQLSPNDQKNYSIIDIIVGAENLRLTNGKLRGDKDKHDFSQGGSHEWGHGLIVHGGKNLEIDHLEISNCTGDGANTRFTGARDRPELLAAIKHSVYIKHLEQGAFTAEGVKVDSKEKTRSIEPFDLTSCNGEFEFGYSTGYLGYPFVKGRVYQTYFYDDQKNFLERKKCLQFRKVKIPAGGKYLHLEFNQPEVTDVPLHAGAGKGSFIGRITNFQGSVDVHFHHNQLNKNRRLGLAFCGGRQWLIEDCLFAGNGGTAPAFGIDFEDGWEFMQDVVVRNNRFRDNVAGDLVICAGSELLIEGNVFEKTVAVHGRPHNYTFRNNKYTGGTVRYMTRTGVAKIHNNTYENCSLAIVFDNKAVADGLNREAGQAVATPALTLENETLSDVKKVSGTYLQFVNSTMNNVQFVAGDDTRLVRFQGCKVRDSSILYEAAGPPVLVEVDDENSAPAPTGPGLDRRQSK